MPGLQAGIFQDDRRCLQFVIAGSFALLALGLLLPFGWDDELFQSMAMDLVRFNRLPYLGSWAHDFPGIVYVHWLSIVLFGDSTLGFRSFDLLVHLGMSWMLFRMLRRWLRPSTSLIAVLLFNLRYISQGLALAAQRDTYAVFLLLLGTFLLFKARDASQERGISQMLVGLGSGGSFAMMMMMRATYAPFVLMGFAFCWMSSNNRRVAPLFFAIGVLAVLSAVALPYMLSPGGLNQVYLATIRYNLDLYGKIRLPLGTLIQQLRNQKLFWLSGILGLLIAGNRSVRRHARLHIIWDPITVPNRQECLLLIGYGIGGLTSLLIMGKYIPCHFEIVMLLLIPFGALAIESLISALPRHSYRYLASFLLLLFLLLRIYPLYLLRPFVANVWNGVEHPIESAQDAMIAEPDFRISKDIAVANYITRTSPPRERFEACTLTAGIRWRVPLMSASRFTTFYPLSMRTPDGRHPSYQMDWRREYVDSLRTARPYYIVLGNGPRESLEWVQETPTMSIHELPGFDSLIVPLYRFDTTIGGYTILKRKG